MEEKRDLMLARKFNEKVLFDGFFSMIVEGVQRIGKTSYTCKSLALANGEWEGGLESYCVKPDFESVKEWLVFKPKEFIDVVMDTNEKEKCIIWDDAGYFLFSLDWYMPFVKVVSKYMQVCGTQFASLVLTSPKLSLISSKVMDALPDHFVAKVVSSGGFDTHTNRPRLATVYRSWSYPDGRKGGVRTQWKDYFNAMLPDDFYLWYKPKRDSYLELARKLMAREIKELEKKDGTSRLKDGEYMESVYEAVGDEQRLKELNEVITQLSV